MGYTEPKHWVSLDNSFCNLDPPCAQKVTQIEFELGSRWHFGQPKPKMNIIIYNSEPLSYSSIYLQIFWPINILYTFLFCNVAHPQILT